MIHGFTSAGILLSQYINLSGLGTVGKAISIKVMYIVCFKITSFSVYHQQAVVDQQGAVDEVYAVPNYDTTEEICFISLISFSVIVGLSLMLIMMPLSMPAILQYHAWLDSLIVATNICKATTMFNNL